MVSLDCFIDISQMSRGSQLSAVTEIRVGELPSKLRKRFGVDKVSDDVRLRLNVEQISDDTRDQVMSTGALPGVEQTAANGAVKTRKIIEGGKPETQASDADSAQKQAVAASIVPSSAPRQTAPAEELLRDIRDHDFSSAED